VDIGVSVDSIILQAGATTTFQIGTELISITPQPITVSTAGTGTGTVTGIFLAQTIPEPPTLTLLGLGILGLFGYGWRRKQLVA
jgi:hypothetical protein